jgi:hypothetical protein
MPAKRELRRTMAVRKKAIVTNAMEAVGESVEQPRRRSRRAMDLFTRRSATCRSSFTTVSTIYRHIRLPQRIVTARAGVNFFRQIVGVPVLSKEVLSQCTADYQKWGGDRRRQSSHPDRVGREGRVQGTPCPAVAAPQGADGWFCQPVRQLLVIVGRDGYARALCEGMTGDALPRMPIDSRQGTT